MELKDTIEKMTSDEYKDRFIAEYWQTKIRYNKLHKMLIKHKAGTLGFEPNSTIDILNFQKTAMENYLKALEIRAEQENVQLEFKND